jgi:NAD(P)-dependent dehydrogenase (short-subunit alcohol dehydrogenase family)
VKTIVVGASSGLGRCIAIGLAQRGAQVALMARREDKLATAVEEAGHGAVAIACDVTDPDSCEAAITKATEALGGLDSIVYAPAIGPLARIEDVDVETWRNVFDTNVIGASIFTTAALHHLKDPAGRVVYLSSVSASQTPPWPGLSTYAVSKAALDKLVEAWRAEHPEIGFTRLVVGDCIGGEGDGMTQFANDWDPDLAAEFGAGWFAKGYIAGSFIAIDDLVSAVDSILRSGPSVGLPTVVVAPRPQKDASAAIPDSAQDKLRQVMTGG